MGRVHVNFLDADGLSLSVATFGGAHSPFYETVIHDQNYVFWKRWASFLKKKLPSVDL